MKRTVQAPYHLLSALLLAWGALGCGSQPAQNKKPDKPEQETPAPVEQARKDPFEGVHAYLQGLVDERKIAGAVALVTRTARSCTPTPWASATSRPRRP
jgi:hypothetical protein